MSVYSQLFPQGVLKDFSKQDNFCLHLKHSSGINIQFIQRKKQRWHKLIQGHKNKSLTFEPMALSLDWVLGHYINGRVLNC